MADPVELRKLVKQLQSSPSPTDIIGVLTILKTQQNVTEAILRETKAGLAVGKLRSHASKEVADLAKEIVKKWKTAVEKAKHGSSGGTTPKPTNGKPFDRKSSTSNASTPVTPTAMLGKQETRTSKSDAIKGGTGDSTRDKCTELIYDALASDSSAPIELVLSRARGIEKCVYNDNGGTTAVYKQKIRTLFVNLKDKNNPGLRETVVSGDLAVERFTKMTSQEMASEERKAADSKIKEENLFKSLSAAEQQAETDAFQCSRCKQRKCRYRQAQTRSADEPMTTFVTCTNCGNRWKFS
ncbi:transcription elongation factor [Macrolepiota fuliginosa MF-IS2]|uniref:Transcription elongation factor n=1 Tax=Macrolepiota fuliginosa MF-IS2 TaxID=1400762 RepID=A0A9P6C5G7_9AGAR|nr:transcription elongation factor [Macrolepiota fuliginosa MF-IS2]